jgi:hypothetical protein
MNFGNLAVTSTAGTVVMAPTVGAERDVTGGGGGVTLPSTTGSTTAAKFTVSGEVGYAYTLTIPTSSFNLTHTNDTDIMSLGTFTSSIATTAGAGSLTTGSQIFYVGATLSVAATQLAGIYSNTTDLDVSVNYN